MSRSFSVMLLGAAVCLLFAGCGESINLALNKPVVASSFEKANTHSGNIDFTPESAVDGNPDTKWASDFRRDADPDAAWIYVDLGQKIEFKLIKIFWETAYARAFSIEVSDDAITWQAVSDVKITVVEFADNECWSNIKFDTPVAARYVKMSGKKRATQYGYSIYELEIY